MLKAVHGCPAARPTANPLKIPTAASRRQSSRRLTLIAGRKAPKAARPLACKRLGVWGRAAEPEADTNRRSRGARLQARAAKERAKEGFATKRSGGAIPERVAAKGLQLVRTSEGGRCSAEGVAARVCGVERLQDIGRGTFLLDAMWGSTATRRGPRRARREPWGPNAAHVGYERTAAEGRGEA